LLEFDYDMEIHILLIRFSVTSRYLGLGFFDIEMYMSNLFSERDGLGAKTFVAAISKVIYLC
jgi:hypothetical protein